MDPVTHISLNLPSGMLLSMRVVPDGRDGNVVFGRTLRWGEADDGRGVPVARVCTGRFCRWRGEWTRPMNCGRSPSSREGKRWIRGYAAASERRLLFRAWGAAEMAVIALHRAARLAEMLARWLDVTVPDDVRRVAASAKLLRDALEHIEERTEGMVRGRIDAAALEIFDQGDFIEKGRLTYDGHVLDIETDMIGALLGCRQLIMSVAREKRAARSFQKRTAHCGGRVSLGSRPVPSGLATMRIGAAERS